MPSFDAPNGQGSEYSWPFSDGKGTAVDQAKWQDMAARMTYTAVSGKLGDAALQVSISKAGTPPSVDVAPGEAMVRGFCYKTDGVTVQLKDNSRTPQPRLDTIVLRLDMANNNISATSLMGAPAEDPKPAELKREQGGVWDFPIAYVLLKKSSNEIAEIADLRIFSDGGNLPQAYDPSKADVEPNPGDLLFMREAKSGYESFVSYSNRGGWAINEDIGKYRTYKPNLNYASVDSPKPETKGHWKWISQNTVYFCANITNNDNTRNIVAGGQQTYMNVDLPVKARGGMFQLVNATLFNNSDRAESEDNYYIGNAYLSGGSTCQPVFPNVNNYRAMGDWLTKIPHNAAVFISGVYEADQFREGNS